MTVRYRLESPEATASATDVVGILLEVTGEQLRVERRDGSVAQVPLDAVIITKVVAA